MTQRERKLTLGALGALVVVVGFVAADQMILSPLQKAKQELTALDNEYGDKLVELRKKRAERQEYQRLRGLSLPAGLDPRRPEFDLAWNEYDRYLRYLLHDSKLRSVSVTGTPPTPRPLVSNIPGRNKKSLYTPLTYTVEARGDLADVVRLLRRFYETPLLHQIKTLSIKPAQSGTRARNSDSRELALKMTVEGLVVQGAEKRSSLVPTERRLLGLNALAALFHGPTGLALIPLTVDETGLVKPRPLTPPSEAALYSLIDRRNIFFETVPPAEEKPPRDYPDVRINDHIRLTSIVHAGIKWEAFFYDVFNNVNTRVRAMDWPGGKRRMVKAFRNVPIFDNEGERHTALVVRIDDRDIYFWYDGDYYRIHIGETLGDAFQNRALSEEQVAKLGLPPDPEKEKD